MKKIFFAAAMALMAIAAPAKTADELRVYINPGHGSWTPNDRPMAILGHGPYSRTNTDTLSFFESNTNLRKGFGVLEKLRAFGLKYDPTLNQTGERHQIGAARDMENNIVMSHVKCGPYHDDNGTENQLGANTPADIYYYNRSLPEICIEVDSNNFDMFISIHSNAVDSGGWKVTNFPIILYRGFDNADTEHEGIDLTHQRTCRQWAQTVWPYHMSNTHECWTAYSMTSMNVRGDCNFYASPSLNGRGYYGYLGVLKHGVPGFLVEGYFHQYAPAALRHMNWDVDYIEGFNYAHGIADIFNLKKESTGEIYGIVRDQHEKFENPDYVAKPGSDDMYKPLNDVKVLLKKGAETVAEYTTDKQYNGAFVFYNVEPGTYTLEFEAEGYLPVEEPVEVTVKAAEVSYPKAFLVSESYVPPTIIYVNYPDELKGTAYGARPDYTFASKEAQVAELEGKTVRRMVAHNGKLYILAENAEGQPTILVVDGTTLAVLATPSIEGCEGTEKAVSDIQVTADGVLIACNKELCQYSADQVDPGFTRGDCNIYRWANDKQGLPEGAPTVWLTTQKSGNFYRAYTGESMHYTGTTEEGTLLLTSETTADSHNLFFSLINVMGGQKISEDHRNSGAVTDYLNAGVLGHGFTLTTSPLDDMSFIVDGPAVTARQYAIGNGNGDMTLTGTLPADYVGVSSNGYGLFKYSGHSYMVAPDVDAEGANVGLRLIDITEGLDAAEMVPTFNTSLEAAAGEAAAAGYARVTYDEMEKISGASMVLYLLRGDKLVRFTTEGVKQNQPRREYAYNVKGEDGDDTYTITFDATGAAPEANIILTPGNGGEAIVVPAGAVEATGNTVTINKGDLDAEVSYTWEVQVVSKAIAEAGEVSADPYGVITRGSVVTITDPSQPSFGYTVVGHGKNAGIDIFNPAGEKVADKIFKDHAMFGGAGNTNQSDPFRGNEYEGKAVLATWGDKGYGAVVVDPLDTSAEPFTLFAGEKEASGNFKYNGVSLGGGTAGISFIKDEAGEAYMMSFSEDHAGTSNTIVRYHLSSPWQITEAPVQLGYNALLANTNVDIVTYGKGIFVSQVRGSGNNAKGCPCFAYITDVLTDDHFTAMTSADDGLATYIDNNTAGIAITPDGKVFAAALAGKIVVFDVTWNEDGDPVMTYRYDFAVDTHSWSTMRFDAGGNIHAYLRENGYHVYSLPAERPEAVTPAAAQYVILGTGTGIETVDAAKAEAAEAVYYNLQGVQVARKALTPGIYIKVAGKEASKVVIK